MTAIEFRNNLIELRENLMRYAYSLTNNKDLSQDLVQETILKALANREKFVYHSNLKAWAFTIMKNTFINDYRQKQKKYTYRNWQYDTYSIYNTKTFTSEDPSRTYLAMELIKCVDQLEESFKAPLKLRIRGYKYKEIAQELNLNIGTVKSRIFLSRKQLAEIINQ